LHLPIERHSDCARVPASEIANRALYAIVHVHGHAIAGIHASADALKGKVVRFAIEISVGERTVLNNDPGLARNLPVGVRPSEREMHGAHRGDVLCRSSGIRGSSDRI
jgi:hypothetical protein